MNDSNDFLNEYRHFWADGPWGVWVPAKNKRVGAVDVSDQPSVGLRDGRVVPAASRLGRNVA